MLKIQKITDLEPTIAFSEYDFYSQYKESFASSELGGLYRALPWEELVKTIGLKESLLGRDSHFSPWGKIALMVLKSYTGLSDAMLIDNLNSNIHYQLFCGVRINPLNPLTNDKIVSQYRCEIASLVDLESFQQTLATYWKPYLEELSVCMTDATCYESYIRHPTPVKLLWESIDWLHQEMCILYKSQGHHKPRTKYDKQSEKYHTYCKKRKPRKSQRKVLTRSLLHLLNKLIGLTDHLLSKEKENLNLSARFLKRYPVIKKINAQQHLHFEGKKVKHTIVSIDKPYIRPIVRGKEKKKVEFGAKVNLLQTGGINFIEHFSYEAFNEGTHLESSIIKHQQLFHRRVKLVAADAIYATNANRKYCSKRRITTSFVRKGRPGKDEEQIALMRSILSKERSTRLEGSFGTQKLFYNLQKVKARRPDTEMLWILFGIHTANAVSMIEKMNKAVIQSSA